jgi:hypothetical protein
MPPESPTATPVATPRVSIARLIARLYAQAAPAARWQLLVQLLRPLGPLALVAIAAGAFARLLPASRWQGVQLTPDDARHFTAQQVFELARYVEQKSPELLLQLPELVNDPRLWLGSATGALLLAVLRASPLRAQADTPLPSSPADQSPQEPR